LPLVVYSLFFFAAIKTPNHRIFVNPSRIYDIPGHHFELSPKLVIRSSFAHGEPSFTRLLACANGH
jgi:hypothetical protein